MTAHAGDITSDDSLTEATEATGGRRAFSGAPGIHTARFKLAASVVVTAGALLASALIYSDQADLYESSFAISIIRQITRETVFQPIYLVIVLSPIYIAAARNVSWIALVSGGLIMLSILLPWGRWEYLDIATGEVKGAHNSLYQLAGPLHNMPQFVSVTVLMMLGGATALFWRVRIGGIITIMGAVTTVFVWPAVLDDPPLIDNRALIVFQGDSLLFGFYIAVFGALIAIIGQASLLARLTGRGRSDDDTADDAMAE